MNKLLAATLAAVLIPLPAIAGSGPGLAERGPLAHTYSIVARDPASGQLGVAVQSHWFQVGPVVPWAEAGVGAVATQSFVEVSYGPRGLELMRSGVAPEPALERLLAADEQRGVRQVAMVDARGRVAAWTGERCIAAAGHHTGEGYSVQANLMLSDTVWDAMARAYEGSAGEPLAERLLLALEAAQAEGGDIRGRQSAALIVVGAEPAAEPWQGRLVDLRVDDSPEPLVELRRLYGLHLAYEAMNAGDEAVATGDMAAALRLYSQAAERAPGIVELPFWQAVTLVENDRLDESLPIFRRVFAEEPIWAELVRRLPAADLLPDDPEVIAAILAQAPGAQERGEGDGGEAAAAVRVTGTLTADGVECPALRADDGELYTLAGDLGGFGPGDRVTVTGEPVDVSHCMQGTTLAVTAIAVAE